jgi:uncharacterized protein YdaU (DUF1376 family)
MEAQGMTPNDSIPEGDTRTQAGVRSPAFQFYPADFLSDHNVIAMSLQERGAYITLICLCWQNPLPDDLERLARLCGVPIATFRKMWPALGRCFRPDPDQAGFLMHPRLERERVKQDEFRQRQSENGRHGGRPRKPNPNPKEPTAFSGLTQTEPNPNPEKALHLLSSSSSSSSDCGQPRARRESGLMTGSRPMDHGECLAHGPVCMKPPIVKKYIGRFGGDTAAIKAWGVKVCDRWGVKVDRGEKVPYGDDFSFWAAAYDEDFGAGRTSAPREVGRQVDDADKTAAYLANMRRVQ